MSRTWAHWQTMAQINQWLRKSWPNAAGMWQGYCMIKHALRSLPIIAISVLAAHADGPLSADEFDAYTKGKTLTYAEQGQSYGAEEYYPNNQVKWAFDNGECLDGIWYEDQGDICFVYEDGGAPQCWQFYLEDDKLRAIFSGDTGTELYEAYTSDGPMQCMGPQVGV